MENLISTFRIQKHFSFQRISNMISWIYCQSRLSILGCLIGGGLVFALMPSMMNSNSRGFSLKYLFVMVIPIIVFIYFSKILNHFTTKSSSIQFLTLPATALEKFLAELFFIILPILPWFILYHIGKGQVEVGSVINRIMITDTKGAIGFYIVVYLISSISFKSKRNNIVVGIISMFMVFFLFGNSFITDNIVAIWADVDSYNKYALLKTAKAQKGIFSLKIDYPTWIETMIKRTFYVAYILLFIASYFRIKEKEIK